MGRLAPMRGSLSPTTTRRAWQRLKAAADPHRLEQRGWSRWQDDSSNPGTLPGCATRRRWQYSGTRNLAFHAIRCKWYSSGAGKMFWGLTWGGRKQKRAEMRVFTGRLAERVGFEPTVGLRLRLISSQVHSTTLPPLREGAILPAYAAFVERRKKLIRVSSCFDGKLRSMPNTGDSPFQPLRHS